jgi:predicted cation transporter
LYLYIKEEGVIYGLFAIMLLVFILPFAVKKVEEELEIFLFIMGIAAVTVTRQWNMHLLHEALLEPVKITIAVFAAGMIFRFLQKPLAHNINKIEKALGLRLFVFLLVVLLGLISSVITAIVAALVLVEITGHLKLDRKSEINLVIMACFSIGLGAALTPIGEPLSTIAISKLKGPPHNADFWFLMKHMWYLIIPAVFATGILSMFLVGSGRHEGKGLPEAKDEGMKEIGIRTLKIYLFVMALVFLGSGFKPVVDEYVSKVPFYGLYWMNIVSAVLDNATLAAAEIGPSMSLFQIIAALLGLIIAGGMLIPGNIPNIISAGKLKIKSSEWARLGVPLGLVMMTVYFVIILSGGIK